MIGYFNDEESTKKTLVEGNWLKTGDQFILREDGYGVIVGRLKDMLIRGGENIFPKVLKYFLYFLPFTRRLIKLPELSDLFYSFFHMF